MKEKIYSSQIHAGSRTYFFDVKKTTEDKPYVELTESRKKSDDSFERHNIMIFKEDVLNIKNEFNNIFEKYFN